MPPLRLLKFRFLKKELEKVGEHGNHNPATKELQI